MANPVSVAVGGDGCPVDTCQVGVGDDAELVFAGEVVADVPVGDLTGAGVGRVLQADEDGHSVAAACTEDFAAFLPGELTSCALVSAKVEHVDVAVFVGEAQTDTVSGVAVDPATVGDEGDDTGVSDSVGGPAEGSQVRVVEAVFVSGGRAGRI